MKKLQSLILAILWSTGFAVATSSGTCGDDLTWTLDDDGVLTISGTGAMTSYSTSSTAPWYGSRTSIKSVIVEEGVTTIGAFAFYYLSKMTSCSLPETLTDIYYGAFRSTSITSIEIPSSVTHIGGYTSSSKYGAFYNCTDLESVTFKDDSKLKTISYYAFSNCTALTSIELPNSITTISTGAFYECTALISINIPNSLSTINSYTFYGCSALESVSFPDGLKKIDYAAFNGCTSLTSIEIPSSVTTIGGYSVSSDESKLSTNATCYYGAFSRCTALTQVTFAEGSQLTKIGNYAFSISGLTNIEIPSSVTSIGYCAFYSCGLKNVTFGDDSELTTIGDYAFYSCGGLSEITIPALVTTIGTTAFGPSYCLTVTSLNTTPPDITSSSFCETCCTLYAASLSYFTADYWEDFKYIYGTFTGHCGDSLTWTLVIDETGGALTIEGNGGMYDYTSTTSVPWYRASDKITSVTFPKSMTSIGTRAFSGCTSLESVTFEDESVLESIGTDAFYECTSLTSIELPSSVASIGTRAFRSCSALTSIEIPSTVTSIGYFAFYYCSSLKSVAFEQGSSLTTIKHGTFSECRKLTSIEIPASITSITCDYTDDDYNHYGAFYNCDSLESVTFEEGSKLEEIGNFAFNYCTDLTSIEIPSTVSEIGQKAFYKCTNLTSITSYNTTPPTAYDNTFSSDIYSIATLYATSTDYETATCWKNFYYIELALAQPVISANENGYTKAYGGDDIDFTELVTYNPGEAEITITYIEIDSDGNETGTETTSQPSEIGSYKVTISVAETSVSESASAQTILTIKAVPTLTVIVEDINEGETPSVIIETDSDGEQTITFADESGNETTDEPIAAGNYSVIVNIAESDNYLAASDTATFSIMAGNAISDIAAEASTIRTIGNTIVITSPALAMAKVVSLSGIVIKEAIVYQGETQIEMAHGGGYIVLLSDGTKAKVLIK